MKKLIELAKINGNLEMLEKVRGYLPEEVFGELHAELWNRHIASGATIKNDQRG